MKLQWRDVCGGAEANNGRYRYQIRRDGDGPWFLDIFRSNCPTPNRIHHLADRDKAERLANYHASRGG